MSVIIGELYNTYQHYFVELANPLIKDWFLMGSPFPGLAIIGAYIYFVQTLGPAMMEGRQPYSLKRAMQIFNVIQIYLSGYMFYKLMKYGWAGKYNWRCEGMNMSEDDPNSMEVAAAIHMYFLVKVTDLIDTVFFVLRKKFNQITFLHLYHHAGMVAVGWGIVKWYTTGAATMLPTVNSLVHTVMYGYYLLTSISEQYRKSIWWKKYITLMQLAQFLFMLMFYGQMVFYNPCNFPKFGLAIVLPQNVFMFVLFSDFYYKAYIKTAKKQS